MNMMSVLLGATGLLLVAALILSFGSMNSNLGSAPTQKDLSALRTEIEVLRAAEAELRLMRQQKTYTGSPYTLPPVSPATAAAVEAEVATIEANSATEIAILKQELADAKEDAARNEQRAETFNEEANLAWRDKIESNNTAQRQARIIKEALLIATVTEWSPDDGFLVININRPESAQVDTVLAIRRNTGIIGRVKVSQVYPDGATADPLPGSFFGGTLDIQAGDELIIPPI